jgi:hypothetical protein
VFNSPVLSSLYREIIDLSAEYRLPTMYQWKEHMEAGGLLSYGVSLAAMWLVRTEQNPQPGQLS